MMYKNIVLKKGKEVSLNRFHPWIFSGAIAQKEKELKEGEVVKVVDAQKNFLGLGHYQIGSIAVRILSFEEVEINQAFWLLRLKEAFQLRESLGLITVKNNTFRLVHGEGDDLPGLIIDVYGNTAVMQAHSVGMHLHREEIACAIVEATNGMIENVYYKSENTLPFKAYLRQENYYICGKETLNIPSLARENDLLFNVDWVKGQKTGFFVDQRDNRVLLEKYVSNKKVLNTFCYTGGFSVYALRGGASLVHSVDSSEKAICLTEENVKINFPSTAKHKAFAIDAFKFLQNMEETYDIIVLDPPAFAKHKEALHNAIKGYTRINAKAIEKLPKGGLLFTFSCSQAVSKEQFRLAVFTAAAQSKRRVKILHQLHQPADHPINIYHPEGEYLKGLVLVVE